MPEVAVPAYVPFAARAIAAFAGILALAGVASTMEINPGFVFIGVAVILAVWNMLQRRAGTAGARISALPVVGVIFVVLGTLAAVLALAVGGEDAMVGLVVGGVFAAIGSVMVGVHHAWFDPTRGTE